MNTKKYRVNESEHFNLFSMYEKLKAREIDMEEGLILWDDKLFDRIEELERLMDAAPYVGALVDWPTLKRIREIKAERQMIRYSVCRYVYGDSEADASMAFDI